MSSSNSQMTSATVFERPNRLNGRNQITYEPDNNSKKMMSNDSNSYSNQSNNSNYNNNNNNNNDYYNSNNNNNNNQLNNTQNPKILELTDKVAEMENRLQNDFSLSEASKYALKKEIAKSRANIMRLKRSDDSR